MSMNGIRTQDKWDQIPSVPEQAAIGYLHLSFEYHKTNLKIRVWQVSDLLLPPPQTSMIDSIFVKSYLIPDPVKKTNRRTEDVRVEPVSKDPTQPAQTGIQHIFTPSSFRFDTPLLYMGVTQEIVAERSLQLEVCMTQKHSHKTFLVAMVHMPLRTAVRRPIREKYPLIACMNCTIPNNMRVYSAKDIIIEGSSNRSISRSSSTYSNTDSPVTARDVHLEGVEVENFMRRFISVDMSDSDDEDDGVGSSIDVKSSLGKSVASSTATVDVMSDEDDPASLREVVGHKLEPPKSVSVNIGDGNKSMPKRKIIPNEVSVDEESGSESEDDIQTNKKKENSIVIKVEEDLKETVVDIAKLQGDIVLDLDSSMIKPKENTTSTSNGKKKIIPPELLSTTPAKNEECQVTASDKSSNHSDASDNGCVYDDIRSDSKNNSQDTTSSVTLPQTTAESSQVKVDENNDNENKCDNDKTSTDDLEDDLANEVPQTRLRTSSFVSGSSSTPVSRPETPVWDFYDFADDGTENDAEGEDAQNDSGQKDDATKALGSLQKSLLRLSKGKIDTLETCRVSGPVLPTVTVEDFEMDEEPVEVEEEEEEEAADDETRDCDQAV